MKDKENVLSDYLDMIFKSWTYERLTDEEKTRYIDMVNSSRTKDILKGDYRTRWNILDGLYSAYLMALDYKPIGWREEKEMNF